MSVYDINSEIINTFFEKFGGLIDTKKEQGEVKLYDSGNTSRFKEATWYSDADSPKKKFDEMQDHLYEIEQSSKELHQEFNDFANDLKPQALKLLQEYVGLDFKGNIAKELETKVNAIIECQELNVKGKQYETAKAEIRGQLLNLKSTKPELYENAVKTLQKKLGEDLVKNTIEGKRKTKVTYRAVKGHAKDAYKGLINSISRSKLSSAQKKQGKTDQSQKPPGPGTGAA